MVTPAGSPISHNMVVQAHSGSTPSPSKRQERAEDETLTTAGSGDDSAMSSSGMSSGGTSDCDGDRQTIGTDDAEKEFKQKMLSRHLSAVLSLTSAELQLLQQRLQQQQPTAAAAKAAESPQACTAAATGAAAASCAYYNIGDDRDTCYCILDSCYYTRKFVGLRRKTTSRTSTW